MAKKKEGTLDSPMTPMAPISKQGTAGVYGHHTSPQFSKPMSEGPNGIPCKFFESVSGTPATTVSSRMDTPKKKK